MSIEQQRVIQETTINSCSNCNHSWQNQLDMVLSSKEWQVLDGEVICNSCVDATKSDNYLAEVSR